jgi:hypothetical protein
MYNKYKKLVDTLPKESEDLWFEYNLAVNKIIQENQLLHNKIDKAVDYLETNGYGYDCCGDMCYFLDEDNQKDLLKILKDSDVDE